MTARALSFLWARLHLLAHCVVKSHQASWYRVAGRYLELGCANCGVTYWRRSDYR